MAHRGFRANKTSLARLHFQNDTTTTKSKTKTALVTFVRVNEKLLRVAISVQHVRDTDLRIPTFSLDDTSESTTYYM